MNATNRTELWDGIEAVIQEVLHEADSSDEYMKAGEFVDRLVEKTGRDEDDAKDALVTAARNCDAPDYILVEALSGGRVWIADTRRAKTTEERLFPDG